jgi:hypothetical protein
VILRGKIFEKQKSDRTYMEIRFPNFTHYSEISLSGIYQREVYIHTKSCKPMFGVALFIEVKKTGKKSNVLQWLMIK